MAITAQAARTMSTVSLVWRLVAGVRLIKPPRTARKIHLNMTATRSPIWRRSASKFSSRARARTSCSRGSLTSAGIVLTGFFRNPTPDGCPEATIHTRCFSLLSARNEAHRRYGSTQGETQVDFSHKNGPRRCAGNPNYRSEASARPVARGVRHLLDRAAAPDDGTPGSVTCVLLFREPPGCGA